VNKKALLKIYDLLYQHFGPRHWWPADTPFEVMVGAILTQNTSWKNVEKAIQNLKRNKVLRLTTLQRLPQRQLAALIKPAGFYNLKARRLKSFVNSIFLRYNSVQSMFSKPLNVVRAELLQIKGIGPETADSILLYAAKKPIFVVDAYTKRILYRHRKIRRDISYGGLQQLFMSNLPRSAPLFNEYHALLVEVGKQYCRRKPLCTACPLKGI
jgi:endonuclease-3 related protein